MISWTLAQSLEAPFPSPGSQPGLDTSFQAYYSFRPSSNLSSLLHAISSPLLITPNVSHLSLTLRQGLQECQASEGLTDLSPQAI